MNITKGIEMIVMLFEGKILEIFVEKILVSFFEWIKYQFNFLFKVK